MLPIIKAIRKQGLASPYGLVMGASIVFLVAVLFPPNVYYFYMLEQNYMFLDVYSVVFFSFCAAAFLIGFRSSRVLRPESWSLSPRKASTQSPVLYLIVPLIVAAVCCAITLKILGSNVNFIALLASQQGQTMKGYGTHAKVAGIWTKAPLLLTGVLWWIQLRTYQLRMDRDVKLLIAVLWYIGFALNFMTFVAEVDRTALIPLVLGSFLINLFKREASGRLNLRRAFIFAGIGGTLVIATFLGIAFLRGNTASRLLLGSLLGYSIASYNRFSGVLHGQVQYFYAGRGVYLFLYLQNAPFLERFFHVSDVFHWPSYTEIFNSEYASMALAGLNPHYIWAGVFGYLYADIKWGTLVYLFCAGIFTGYLWARLREGATFAIVLYPWVASWIAGWSTSNILFNDDFVHLLPAAVMLSLWDHFLLYQEPAATETRSLADLRHPPLIHASPPS